MWWEHFKSMQLAGHEITWAKFKRAFKDHHIPKGLMVRKMKELLSLKQSDDTVYQYAQKFNSLCQYGEHHVDIDAKKMEHFRDGLRSELNERLNLLDPNSYHELVNKAISQEDAMMKVQKEKKRQNDFASGDGSGKKFRFVKKKAHGSSQSSASGHWRMTLSRISLREIFSTVRPNHKSPSQRNFHPAFATIVGNQGIMPMSAQTLGRTSPSSRIRTPE
jgi:hypothetical protein